MLENPASELNDSDPDDALKLNDSVPDALKLNDSDPDGALKLNDSLPVDPVAKLNDSDSPLNDSLPDSNADPLPLPDSGLLEPTDPVVPVDVPGPLPVVVPVVPVPRVVVPLVVVPLVVVPLVTAPVEEPLPDTCDEPTTEPEVDPRLELVLEPKPMVVPLVPPDALVLAPLVPPPSVPASVSVLLADELQAGSTIARASGASGKKARMVIVLMWAPFVRGGVGAAWERNHTA